MSHKGEEFLNALRLIPLGGLGEIGMNCLALEYEDEIIVIDCGLSFPGKESFGIDFLIPDFSYLQKNQDKLRAFFITHGHEDHIGALPFIFKAGLRCPIYASKFTAILIHEKMIQYGINHSVDLRIYSKETLISFKHFQIRPVQVAHSIVEAFAFFIETPYGKVIHTGDFRIDENPVFHQKTDLEAFEQAGQEGVFLLLSDSTNIEREGQEASEQEVFHALEKEMNDLDGLTIISLFMSNIARIAQIAKIAKQMNKKITFSGRGAHRYVQAGIESGYLNEIQSMVIPLEKISHFPRNQVIVLATGSQGEFRSSLMRIAYGGHPIKLQKGDSVILSSKFIPGNEKAIFRMINQLFRQGADVVYGEKRKLHVSGHGTQADLKKILNLTQPQFFIPIHGEYAHLIHHKRLAETLGIPSSNIQVVVNGDIVQLTKHQCEVVEHLQWEPTLVERVQGEVISRCVMKERRQLGEKGIVFCIIIRDLATQKICFGPEITFKGLVHDSIAVNLIEKAKKLVEKLIKENKNSLKSSSDLQEMIRLALRKLFNLILGKKPLVLIRMIDL